MNLSQVSLLPSVSVVLEFFISAFSLQVFQIFSQHKVMESDWSVCDMSVSACCITILLLTIIPRVLSMM